jgi:hypothetical protein
MKHAQDKWTALLYCNVVRSERYCNLYWTRLNSWRELQGQDDQINSTLSLTIVVGRVLNNPHIIVLTRIQSALALQSGVSNPGKGEGAEEKW